MSRNPPARIALWTVMILVCFGCGKPSVEADVAPFQQAVADYLRANNMDLEVAAFRALDVEGDSARAEVSLGHAGGATGVKVRWTFQFARRAGSWQVTRHEQ